MRVLIQPIPKRGDILLTRRKKSIIGRLIRKFQVSKSDLGNKSIFEHVGVFVNYGQIIEAKRRVELNSFSTVYPINKYDHMIVRRTDISEQDRKSIVTDAFKYLNKKYGYMKISMHFLDYLFGKLCNKDMFFFRALADNKKYPICSWVVAWAYFNGAGIQFNNVAKTYCQPDDISDDCLLRNHALYNLVTCTKGIRKIVLKTPEIFPESVVDSIRYGAH